MEIGLRFLDCDNSSLWSSSLYKDYEDLREIYIETKLSYKFSCDYCNNLKNIYGGKVLVFKGLNLFEDVYGDPKLGIEHSVFIDYSDRVYDPFLGYFDLDLDSYFNYIGVTSKGLSGLLEFSVR